MLQMRQIVIQTRYTRNTAGHSGQLHIRIKRAVESHHKAKNCSIVVNYMTYIKFIFNVILNNYCLISNFFRIK